MYLPDDLGRSENGNRTEGRSLTVRFLWTQLEQGRVLLLACLSITLRQRLPEGP
jgi:hypothetical protein